MPDTVDIVVRSVWDDSRGHALSGILVEGRYRIEHVRDRTQIRSRVLRSIMEDIRKAGIHLARPSVQVSSSSA